MLKKCLFSVILILIIICLFSLNLTANFKFNNFSETIVGTKNVINDENNVVMIINIPEINLNENIYNINNVDDGIVIYNDSSMPDENGILILYAHSGNTSVSYFKNIYKLNLNDELHIYYNDIKYNYKLVKVDFIEKNGYMKITDEEKKDLILVTCYGNKEQIVLKFIKNV